MTRPILVISGNNCLGVAPYCFKRPIYQVTVHFNFIVLNISRLCSKIKRRLGADHKRKNACNVQYYSSNIELNVLFVQGFNDLPICMAKTHLSLSHNPDLKGVPKGKAVVTEYV